MPKFKTDSLYKVHHLFVIIIMLATSSIFSNTKLPNLKKDFIGTNNYFIIMKNEALHAELKYEKKFKIEKKNIFVVMIIFNF